jgi:NAD(P)-dependent dehydrogenase (short-subunit alcohol dehydrogenase family)
VNLSSVDTDVVHNGMNYGLFGPGMAPQSEHAESLIDRFRSVSGLPVLSVEPVDISNAVAWLASSESRHVTGTMIAVDAGVTVK